MVDRSHETGPASRHQATPQSSESGNKRSETSGGVSKESIIRETRSRLYLDLVEPPGRHHGHSVAHKPLVGQQSREGRTRGQRYSNQDHPRNTQSSLTKGCSPDQKASQKPSKRTEMSRDQLPSQMDAMTRSEHDQPLVFPNRQALMDFIASELVNMLMKSPADVHHVNPQPA